MEAFKVLALSGSMRTASTNTHLLQAIGLLAKPKLQLQLASGLNELPIFSPDLEGNNTPANVLAFASQIAQADGIIISSPEYVRAIPGGLKNAIDWLVSRDEIMKKPIALAHASYRGDDMLNSLRSVLSTVSENFYEDCFVRVPLLPGSDDDVRSTIDTPKNVALIQAFANDFHGFIKSTQHTA